MHFHWSGAARCPGSAVVGSLGLVCSPVPRRFTCPKQSCRLSVGEPLASVRATYLEPVPAWRGPSGPRWWTVLRAVVENENAWNSHSPAWKGRPPTRGKSHEPLFWDRPLPILHSHSGPDYSDRSADEPSRIASVGLQGRKPVQPLRRVTERRRRWWQTIRRTSRRR